MRDQQLQYQRRWRYLTLCSALIAALCLVVEFVTYGSQGEQARAQARFLATVVASPVTRVIYAQSPCTPVYDLPGGQGTLLTELLGGTDVTPLGRTLVKGITWQHVLFWSGIEGYINVALLAMHPPANAVEGSCGFPNVPEPQSVSLTSPHSPWSLPGGTTGILLSSATLYAKPATSSPTVAALAIGTSVQLLAWAGDNNGHPWYKAATAQSESSGWLWSGNVSVYEPNPVTHQVKGQAIWMPASGKGMWFTNYLVHHSTISALVHAAKLAGITHLYAEVAITQYGFFGENTLDRLLPAAHAAGIAVIAWVYPTLNNITADVRMTQAVAEYVTKSGDRADGIATDIEEVDDTASVYSYGQLVRTLLGPDTLLVAAVYHPFAEPFYPYAAIAASWNVIAPMDYWHSRDHHSYSPVDVERFVLDSITTIRAAMVGLGTTVLLPVDELGQAYDMYSNDGTGDQDSPTFAEITADMQTAHALGCIGVSFFEWQTATQDEWAAIRQFNW